MKYKLCYDTTYEYWKAGNFCQLFEENVQLYL